MSAPQLFKIIPLTTKEISFLQSLLPAVKEAGVTVTSTMYQHMFKTYPEVKPYFNMTNQRTGKQPKILAFALYQYILHLNNLSPISGFVNQIVVKHCGLGIKPDQYPIVGTCLIHAFKTVLGSAADDHFVDVLSKAYGNLAQTLINAEENIYKTQQWRGFKDFKVTKLVKESENVTSVYLTPIDDMILKPIIPGEYISLKWDINDLDSGILPREYSISNNVENNEYRISVKKLENGKVSTFVNSKLQIGDILPVHSPIGNMIYDSSNSKKPNIVILAGGIGITPMITIIEAALKDGKDVQLFYSSRSENDEPFKSTFENLKIKYSSNFKFNQFITSNGKRLKLNDLDFISKDNYDVYLLGPDGYMHEFKTYLNSKGIDDIKMEFFGPTVVSV
ncbi:hypothetical protein C6P40_000320 [Pichia californica]|uniref:nitric oxide dioxygenase n=1 Tax=Pichia californica TaxID=460514 RepID=A0A9P7BG99_9ASCO|nr:hypothetical protein C6P42_005073 [[Candida] californica]KAG0688955.1 hypothetical protein C6P40_000320 [[Candida] californica]